jgi:integrase
VPREKKPPRLWLRSREGRDSVWIILDGNKQHVTGCGKADIGGAEKALQGYIASKFKPSGTNQAARLPISEVLDFYMHEHVPTVERRDILLYRIESLLNYWGEKAVTEIKRSTCTAYIKWRVAREHRTVDKAGKVRVTTVAPTTARKDLETLRAALNFYHAEYVMDVLPIVSLPEKALPREEWLTRSQVAALLWAAWRGRHTKHVARFILVAVYTGTRTTAILGLKWLPSTSGGWLDLEKGILYRRGRKMRQTNKKQPPARIHARLIPHLRRWQKADLKSHIAHVIHYQGEPVKKLRRSWDSAREGAKQTAEIDFHFTRHTLRHTAATWLMQSGCDIWSAAGFLGMSVETLERVYGHHSPNFQEAASKAIAPKNAPMKRQRNERTNAEQAGTKRLKRP